MPAFVTPTANSVNPAPEIEVYIAGQRKRDVRIDTVTESSGLEPSSVTLLFPTRDYMSHPCQEDDRVLVYINRRYRETPVFRGYVTGFGDMLTLDSGQYVQVFAIDDVGLLNTVVASRNFNIVDTRDEYTEELTIRQIAAELMTMARDALGSSAPPIITASFPTDFPGTMEIQGTPIDEALGQILEQAGTYKWGIRREYTDDQTSIYAYKVGLGEIAYVQYGTDHTLGPASQPDGAVNVGEARREESVVDIVNRGIVVGDRKVIETALPLYAAWDRTKDGLAVDLEFYSDKGTEEEPNPDYDAEAERIGRAWRFSKVNTGSFSEYPDLEPRLLQEPPFGYGSADGDFMKPFVVYQFAGVATWNITTDVTIKDNEIVTHKPLIMDQVTTGASVSPLIASTVYLEAAYRRRDELRVTLAKQGDAGRTVWRYFNKPDDFKYKYQDDYFTLTGVSVLNGTLNKTVTQYYGTYNSAVSVVQNDTTAATTWGNSKLRAMRDKKLEIAYVLPRMDMHYRVGQRVNENGLTLDANIASIEYNLSAMTTTLRVASR